MLFRSVVKDTVLYSGDAQAVTIKGGSQNIRLTNVAISGSGSEGDIVLGGWSDQSMSMTTGVVLENVSKSDGSAVRVVLGKADKPTIIGGNCKIDRWQSFLLKAYCFIKGLFK